MVNYFMIDLNYRYKKQNFIQSNRADAAPPLGTILGNLGAILQIFVITLIYLLKNCHLIFF